MAKFANISLVLQPHEGGLTVFAIIRHISTLVSQVEFHLVSMDTPLL